MAAQIVLRYMNGLEGDPLNHTVPYIEGSDVPVVQVVKRHNGSFELRDESPSTKNANGVYARFQASPPFLLEPLVEGVVIEPPPSHVLSLFPALAELKVPVSSDASYSFICLRLGDTVSFSHHDYFKSQFDIQVPDMAPQLSIMASSATVHDGTKGGASTPGAQVHSSDDQSEHLSGQEQGTGQGANDESGSETDDEDLDQSTARTLRTPYPGDQGTPATSNPTTIGEIKETPARSSILPSTMARAEPFSTAPEVSDNIDVTSSAVAYAIDNESPLAKKTRDSQEDLPSTSLHVELKIEPAVNAADEEPHSDAASEELGDIFGSDPMKQMKPLVTYSKQPVCGPQKASGKRTALNPVDTIEDGEDIHVTATSDAANDEPDHVPIVDDEDIEVALVFNATNEELGFEQMPDGENIDVAVNEETIIVQTSDPLDDHAAAHKAAERTMQQRGTKRKRLPKAAQEEDEDKAPVPQKRTKKSAAKNTAESIAVAEPTSPASPKGAVAKATRSSKPAKVTRQDSAEDEITVTQVQKVVKKSTTPKQKATPSSFKSVSGKAPRATPDSSASSAMSGKAPKVLFSTSTLASTKSTLKWLRQQESEILKEVKTKRTHFVCVVKNGPLSTTAKVLRTLAVGKLVVTEDWVTDSQREGQLLEPDDYVHTALEDTIGLDRSMLFEDKIMYFTKKLVIEYGSGWDDVKELAKECGARMIEHGSAAYGEKTAQVGETLFFGAEKDDKDVADLIRAQHVVYHKDLLAKGVLRGEVDLDSDEFELQAATPSVKKKSRKR